MRSTHTVRLTGTGHYASGLLFTRELVDACLDDRAARRAAHRYLSARADLVLTAAHFLRGPAGAGRRVSVHGRDFTATAAAHISVFGTDLAVVRLNRPAPAMQLPAWSPQALRPGQRTTTFGFGGRPKDTAPKELSGRVLTRVPLSLSRNPFTRVRHGALLWNSPVKAIPGDSGGPVLVDGLVCGVQSMITDPFGLNSGIATVAATVNHLPALRRAITQLGG